MNLHIKTFQEFADERKEYDGTLECFVAGCNKPAYYEGGDCRFYCGVCEEHAQIKGRYEEYLRGLRLQISTRMKWDKNDPTLAPLYDTVTTLLKGESNGIRKNEEAELE